ncbi:hypothetical protein B0H11DRAFT_1911211 [Mycena galericulata]|nr:hypothetical protein B0H11DRAFT_1911211 [Mycena galericulata]
MHSASTSTASLVSNTSISSRAPLNKAAPVKDFQAAFATLQSTYGFAGAAPSPAPARKPTPSPVPSRKGATQTQAAVVPTTRSPPKDFEAAFANLQSMYGFGGAAPTPIAKRG